MQKALCQATLPFHPEREIEVRFDGGRITSDAGWLLLYALDRSQGLSAGFSSCIVDQRDGRYVSHELGEMVRQRLFQILAGYEDCNDADELRADPMLMSVCERLPESDPELASQPTLSRLENRVSRKDLMRIGHWMLESWARRLRKRRPKRVVLDLDSTDDPTNGQQQLSFYHGFYRSRILHPLLIFDGETGELAAAVLRPGNKGAAFGAIGALKRVIAAVRRSLGAQVVIEIRADAGFASPDLYKFCEGEKLLYEIGLVRNPRLAKAAEPVLERARREYESSGRKQRLFDEFAYQAESWPAARRVVAKAEVSALGINRRFVVTNRRDLDAQGLYERYACRGQAENFIKAFKNDLAMDRLSCHRFSANQFRLLLHGLAYNVFVRLRDYLWGTPCLNLTVETLRRRLIKIGARVRESTRRIWVHCSSAYPDRQLFLKILGRLHPA